jgi:Protein of unknown function (DUF2917)
MSRNQATEVIRTVDLGHEQLLILDNRAGARIRVLSGGSWLTEEGKLGDFHPAPGDALTLSTPGRAVLEAVGSARIEITLPARAGWLARVAQAVAAWRRGGQTATGALIAG